MVEYPITMVEGRGRPLNKLQTTRKGQMKVMEVRDDAYDLLELVSRKIETVHISRLHPFIYDEKMVIRKMLQFEIKETSWKTLLML